MSYLDEQKRQLILDLLLGRVSEEAFFREFPSSPAEIRNVSLKVLEQALNERDPVGVEFGLHLGHRFGFSPVHLETLCALAKSDWHDRHQDVVDGLASLEAPGSVETLYQTALSKHPYLNYDDANTLGVKSIWALGRINTPEAVLRLEELLSSDDAILVSEAKSQLARIEKHAESEGVRLAARMALRRNRYE